MLHNTIITPWPGFEPGLWPRQGHVLDHYTTKAYQNFKFTLFIRLFVLKKLNPHGRI